MVLISVVVGGLIAGVSNWLLTRTNLKARYKLVIYDKRIEVHQKAYSLMWELARSLHDEQEKTTATKKCHNWWIENRLYLTREADKDFKEAYRIANSFHKDGSREQNQKVHDQIDKAAKEIVMGVGLEYLGGFEREPREE